MSSTIIDLSYQQTTMDTDEQSNLVLYHNNNYSSLSMNMSRNDSFMELHGVRNAIDALEFILSNGTACIGKNTNNNENLFINYDKQQLIEPVQNYNNDQNLLNLVIQFINLFDIYLYFIAFGQSKFEIVSEFTFLDKNKQRKMAFVVLNGDKTICGPLFVHGLTGKQTVFTFGDNSVALQVDKYIEKLNTTDPRLIPITQENSISIVNQNSSNDMPVNDISASVSDFNSEILDSSNTTMEVYTFDQQKLHQNIQTDNTPSTLDTISSSIREPGNHEDVNSSNNGSNHQVQSSASDRVRECDQIPAQTTPSSSTYISNTTEHSQTVVPAPPSTSIIHAAPKIINQPKSDWTRRYPKDLIPEPKKEEKEKPRKQTKKKNNTTFIGLLQGAGSQRSRIKVQVPPKETRKMYLASNVRTINNQHHLSKVIVPEKTKVNKERFNHENILNYLEFDECNPMHFFDDTMQIVYMEITSQDHEKGFKEVPVYMFNLYQNNSLTKTMIEHGQLNKCQLAFWLCVKENENYIPISQESLSRIITEKEKTKKKDPPWIVTFNTVNK